ncbi:MAG: TonB-dependent receptor plug domain-containing protein, partial [Oleibacter sp.]|nr:TonB-dependent receptor plug domain-containing protein [Thalassolituus sp.]
MTKRYCTLFIIILISYSAIYAEVQAEEYDAVLMDEDTLDSRPLFESQDVPEVLTATRLRQPRVEVPGSMTIITAEQIAAWGVRTIPELMRFVPGMFVKHGANDTVAYHASSPNFMRRFQVLVDGRSVYRVILSSITWEEIPVAVEDIQRIEVFRGPNSATYGANAFMAVVNIITFNPSDTLGTQASVRTGSQMTRDYRVSHSAMSGTASYRISLNQQGDDGFDGVDAEHDELSDSKKTRFVNGSYADVIFNDVQLSVDASYLTSSGELPIDDTQIDPTIEHVNAYSLMTQINADLSKQHKLEAQAYVQTHERLADGYGCLPTASIDPTLYALYERNPLWASVIGEGITGVYANEAVDSPTYQQADALVRGISAGVVTPELVEAQLESAYDYDFVIEQQDLADAAQVFSRAFNGSDFNNLGQVLCGTGDYDFSEQRVDVEMEFTSQWLDNLRTAAGLGYRRDTVKSDVYFGGTRINNN